MPTASLYRDDLRKALGREVTEDEFRKECFQFGLELDEVTSEKEMITKEKGAAAAADADERVIWKVDIPANRHDLLCQEGLVKAMQIFEGKKKGVEYIMRNHLSRNVMTDGIAIPGKSASVQLIVKKGVADVRPFMVSAILRNVKFTSGSLQSFIDYQDKLHQNICRRRTLASIGERRRLIESCDSVLTSKLVITASQWSRSLTQPKKTFQKKIARHPRLGHSSRTVLLRRARSQGYQLRAS